MSKAAANDNTINTNNSFTELFNLLKKYQLENGNVLLDYSIEEMNKIIECVDSALLNILQGFQMVNNLIELLIFTKKDAVQLSYFSALIGNLAEALFTLRLDLEHSLLHQPVSYKLEYNR